MVDRTRHHHRGRSSREFLDGKAVVGKIGLRDEDVFLDAGCGDGHISLAASAVVGGGVVFALDVDEESVRSLERARSEGGLGNICPLVADLEKIPLAKGTVDLALMANVMHGFGPEELDGVMGEMARVTRGGGTLVVVDFKKEEALFGPPMWKRLYPEEVEEMVGRYGFEETEVIEVGQYHYAVILRRR